MCYTSVSSVKKKNLCQKEKQYSFKLHDYCSYFMSDGHFNRLIIYQNGITMNISNTSSVTVLSNFQFNLFFSMLKKGCKNKYICSSDLCLSHIITFSRTSLYYLFHGRFFCLIGRLKVTPVFIQFDETRKQVHCTFFWVILMDLEKVHYF